MPYDQKLAERIRGFFGAGHDAAEKKMFGGLGFLIKGNMCCGVWRNDLILRVGREVCAELLGHPDVQAFDPAGRPMAGWLLVKPAGCRDDEALAKWLDLAIRFSGSLSPKETPERRRRMR